MVVFWNGCPSRKQNGTSTYTIQDKGGFKPCNVSLYMVDSLCNCLIGIKSLCNFNQLLLEDQQQKQK